MGKSCKNYESGSEVQEVRISSLLWRKSKISSFDVCLTHQKLVSLSREEQRVFRISEGRICFDLRVCSFTEHKKAPVLEIYEYNCNLKALGARKTCPETIIL